MMGVFVVPAFNCCGAFILLMIFLKDLSKNVQQFEALALRPQYLCFFVERLHQ